MKGKLIGAFTVVVLTSNAFAARTAESAKGREGRDREAVSTGRSGSNTEKSTQADHLISAANKVGLLNTVSTEKLKAALMEDKNPLTAEVITEKNGKMEKSVDVFKLSDILQDLTNQLQSGKVSNDKLELSQNLVEALSSVRGQKMSGRLNKLLNEARVMLEAGSKATDREIASFSAKLKAMNDLVREGKADDMDSASEKALTIEEKKKIDDCLRG